MFWNSQWQSAQLGACTHRRQTLTLLHLFTDLFHKEIFPHSSEYLQGNNREYCKYSDE